MSVGAVGTGRAVVLRQSGAVLVPVAVWVFCGLGVADAVIEGTPGYALRTTVSLSAIAWATWLVLASPCLVVEGTGLRVVNPLRVHWVPFAALEGVRVRGLTTLTARHASGRTRQITSWNAPGVPRRYAGTTIPITEVIERFRSSWERTAGRGQPEATVATSWRWRPWLALVALVAASTGIWFR
ncbi:MAG: hypothetical protein JWQ93_937 [Marmoricola sp.]|nr:hypothetical protein [Marmoricola sp.]